jgi:hypothetical protein
MGQGRSNEPDDHVNGVGVGFADLEPGDVLAGGAGHFGEQFVAVVDAERVVGGFDGDGAAGVDHADVDALPGNG